ELLYANSHLFRAVLSLLHYDSTLMSRSEREQKTKSSVKVVCEVLANERTLAVSEGAELVAVIQPTKAELIKGDKGPGGREPWVAVKGCARELATIAIDLRELLLKTFQRDALAGLYWPIDLHFNAAGYEAYAAAVAREVAPLVARRRD